MTEQLNNSQSCLNNENESNLNHVLRTDAKEIFNKELKTDQETTTVIVGLVNDEHNKDAKKNDITNAQWFDEYAKKLRALSSPIILEYHKSEIENVNNIIKSILTIIKCISILTILFVAVFAYLDKDVGAIISGVTGGVIDIALSVLISLFNSTLKSKKSYFDSERDTMKLDKMLLIVHTISNQETKDSVIEAIVRKHFDVNTK